MAAHGFALQAAAAQSSIAYSRHDFGNAYRQDVEIAFPNARSASGASTSDFLWKAFPREALARGNSWRISGIRISFRVDKSYTGALPQFLALPTVAFYPLVEASIEGKTYDVPDLAKPLSATMPLGAVRALQAGPQSYELRLGPKNPDPRLQKPIELPGRDASGAVQGWAVALRAPFNARAGNGQANFLALPTFGEIHRDGSRASYSGLYDAKTKTIRPFGTTGAPANLGELAVELLFDQATLQVYSDGAGGVRQDPRKIETHKGPGAYDNGLLSAIRPGYFGLYAQFEGNEGLLALPLVVSDSATLPNTTLRFEQVSFLYNPTGLGLATLFTGAQVFGALGKYSAGGAAGHRADQDAVWHSGPLAVSPIPALKGLSFWVQALLYDPTKMTSCAETNAVRVRF